MQGVLILIPSNWTFKFKELALKKDSEGLAAFQIFKEAGFDLKVHGKNIPTTCLRNWRYKARHLNINNNKYLAKEVKRNNTLKSIPEENRCWKTENEFLKKLQAMQELAE